MFSLLLLSVLGLAPQGAASNPQGANPPAASPPAAVPALKQVPSGEAPAPMGAVPATGGTDVEAVRGRISALLGMNGPVPPEDWRALGSAAVPILEELALDSHALPTRRARAVEGLAAIGAPKSSTLLVKLARGEHEPFIVRLAAVRGVGRVLSPSRQLVVLRPVLESAQELHLRVVAAEVLSRHASGCSAVRAQLKSEAPESRAQFEPALQRCGD